MDENKDNQKMMVSPTSDHGDAIFSHIDNHLDANKHFFNLKHCSQISEQDSDKLHFYAMLLSPMLYTYQSIFKLLHNIYVEKSQHTEKDLVSLMHNQIKMAFENGNTFMENGTFHIPTITLIRRVIQKLRNDSHEENFMLYPILIKMPESSLLQKPPRHSEIPSALLRTFSDASVTTECETPKKINKNGGLGDVSEDVLCIRREIRDTCLLLNVAEQLKSFIF